MKTEGKRSAQMELCDGTIRHVGGIQQSQSTGVVFAITDEREQPA